MGSAEREREVIRQSRDAIECLTTLLGSLSTLAEDLEAQVERTDKAEVSNGNG